MNDSTSTDSSASFDDTLPCEIKKLIERCEVNEHAFNNADMSVSLKFGETLWRRLARMADYYEMQSANFRMSGAIAPMMTLAAKDMRHVLNDTRKDL